MELAEGEGGNSEDLWTPYKVLVAVVENYLAREAGAPYAVQTFESLLRRHKQTFLSLMKNPSKNATSREEIKRGISEGVNLPSVGHTLLSKELVDEAIIISDMYEVNEYLALELLHTAQCQAPRHPGLPRGLVAVLLYYDGRKCVVQALKELVMAREGVSWCINARSELVSYVTRYVQQLIDEGLLERVLDSLRTLDLASELDLLQNNRALGPPKHQRQVRDTFQAIRKLLAGVIFAASAQRGLARDTLMRLLSEVTRAPNPAGVAPSGALDDIALSLQMALLYALDLSVLHRREDGEELAKKLPLIQDVGLIPALLSELTPAPSNGQQPERPPSGARALCQLALGLALAALKRAPQSLLRRAGNQISSEMLDQDEVLVDAAIDGKVLEYLEEVVLSSENLTKEEYYMRRVHGLITDFIVLMHSKMMDLRLKADEAARAVQMFTADGLDSPQHGGHFDALLRCVERLYQKDPLNLKAEYWAAVDQQHSHSYRSGGRAATLYKFVRLSGELVAPPLLPPYLRALASLAQPQHTWALLARRDTALPSQALQQPAPVSADHLFGAMYRYYCNLRQEPAPQSEFQHAHSLGASALLGARGRMLVRQEEVEALIAALKLIQAVARVDSNACVAICENLQWDAVNCMFGLIGCHIPVSLKAELALALASLGSWPSTAGRVWAAMEAAQMLTTVPSTSAYSQQYGIHGDLEEVESRNEEYPLTRAFLILLDSLCAAGPLPRALGAGARTPGLNPYFTHVLQRIALPAPHRPYSKPAERWQVMSLCLKLLFRWLETYEPSPTDFPPPGRQSDMNPPPGFHIMLQLNTKSDLLRLVLSVLDESVALLDSYVPIAGKNYVEESLVSVLSLLERALLMERQFILEGTSVGCSIIIMGLSKLILAPEGTQSTERLVSVCRVLLHSTVLPTAGARAVSLLCRALQHAPAANQLLAAITANHKSSVEVRHGFVECLEAEEWSSDADTGVLVRQTKESIIQLLQQTLGSPAPNISHYLLGFQLTKDVSRSALNEPGVAGYPRTCLHSLLAILEAHIAGGENTERQANNLIESGYRLLYYMCAPATAAPTLRFLRSRDNFLARHIKAHVSLEAAAVVTVSARSWLLRACACEAGAAAAARQHAALATMLKTLTASTHHPTQEWEWCLLRRLLEGLPVSVAATPEPRWELFHAAQLRQAIASCDQSTALGGKRINVSKVHALLVRELSSLQATAPQRSLVAAEIEKVLDYVTEVNRQRNLAATLTHYYDSWRQITEILFCVAPQDILNLEARKNLLLNILQDLLNKIPPAEVLPQLGNLSSGTILILMVNLRHCYVTQKRESNIKTADFETTFFGPSSHLMQTKSLSLKFILNKILSWILVSGMSTQKMRINLYGTLLNYLNIVNLKSSPAEADVEDVNSTYVSRLDSSKARSSKEESSLKSMVIDVISGFGESLCNVVCSDCVGAGHDVCRMVALSCLDTLIEIHPHTDWMNILTNRGYLRNLVDSLLHDDEGLRQVLEPSPKSLRVLYVYESKMTLLNKIASTRIGAETVLEQSALSCLANMRVLDCHPDIHTGQAEHDATDFVPSVASRYRQILLPALTLCDTLLTTLGTQNHSCIIHVTHFLLSHMETIDMVLRAAHPNSPHGLLVELEAITSVIGRASNQEVFGYVEQDTALQDSAVNLCRVQCLMLALMPRFGGSKAVVVMSREQERDEPQVYYKIVCNLTMYARNILDRNGTRVIFRPALTPAGLNWTNAPENTPHMGAIIHQLQVMVERCHAQSKLLATTHNQLHNVPTMTLDDLKKLLPAMSQESSPLDARQAVLERLTRRADVRKRELAYCCYAVEGTLYLVWTHLQFYLRKTIEPIGYYGEETLHNSLTPSGALQASCASELADLKKGLVSVFNDKFAEELLDTTHGQPPAQRGFLDTLLRDIKSLLQFAPL